jgi:CRP-like cAMP-binding protein
MIKIMLLKKMFDTGNVIFKEGEMGTEAYLIRSGYVTIWKMEAGRVIELATRGPGEIIGEMALIEERPRSASVTAKGKVEVEVITRNELKKMMEGVPEPLAMIIHQLMQRLRDTNELAAMSMSS